MIARRQRAQALGLASVAIVAMVGMLAFVIDAGNFFVIRRELQNIADNDALAGAETLDPFTGASVMPMDAGCAGTALAQMVCTFTKRNSNVARSLCGTDVVVESAQQITVTGFTSPAVRVVVRCEAGYSFGRILNLQSRTMKAQATAVLGVWDSAGNVLDYVPATAPPPNNLTARLVSDQ